MSSLFAVTVGSCSAKIAVFKDGRKEVLANDFGERMTPALVTYSDNDTLIGHSSKQSFHRSSSNTAMCMALLLGRRFSDDSISEIISNLPCKVVERDEELYYCFRLTNQEVYKRIAEPLLEVYKTLYETARTYDPECDLTAVVGVPTYYSEDDRGMIRDCAMKAGFQVLRIISEPTAACLEYGIGQHDRHYTSYILVYDLGMWTLDLTILKVSGGMFQTVVSQTLFNVGGRLFDEAITSHLVNEFERQWKVNVRKNERVINKLMAASESAKCALSNNQSASVHLESLYEGIDFQYTLSRGRFEGLCSSLMKKCIEPVDSIMRKTHLHQDDIGHIVLAGGSCKLPQLRYLLIGKFPNAQHHTSLPPESVAVLGCAQEAGILTRFHGKQIQLLSDKSYIPCTSNDLWIICENTEQKILPKGTPIPCSSTATIEVDINQCQDIELQERNNETKSIAKVPLSDTMLIAFTLEATISWSVENKITLSLKSVNSSCKWEQAVVIDCQ